MRRFSICLALILFTIGCAPTQKPDATKAVSPSATPVTAAELGKEVGSRGSLTFRSWNGRWLGRACDTDLVLLPDGDVGMLEYGSAINIYHGTYTIGEDSAVTLRFPTFGSTWPTMHVMRDGTSLLLAPTDSQTGFVFGNRGGAVISGNQSDFWPFRPVPANDEARLRQTVGQ